MNIHDLPELTKREQFFYKELIEKRNRTYKIDTGKIPEKLLFETDTSDIYFDGVFYFYTGIDERFKEFKI